MNPILYLRQQRLTLVVLTVFCSCLVARSNEQRVDYVTQIKPLLEEKCWACHGVLKQEAGLRLDTRDLMVEDAGVVVPGDSQVSLLIERVAAEDAERMPPVDEGSRLTEAEIKLLKSWIERGAEAPDEVPLSGPDQHWAFQPILQPPSKLASIDVILETQRQQRGLNTVPHAERPLAIRRLYIDLIGLPPTLDQLNDDRPWNKIVNELLVDPRYGERWGRHWMDVWRYSDWYGLGDQLRYSQKHIWHWRDWIIKSLNDDKGYDQMVLEMLAGDELAPEDPDAVAATGFLARNYYLFNRTTWLDSTIEHTGKAFLGLTLNCAKCHDHKYDPISHRDYYQFRAIFEPHQIRLDPIPGATNLEQDGLPRAFDDHLDAVTRLHRRGDPANPDPDLLIEPAVPELFQSFASTVEPVELPISAYAPVVREYVQTDLISKAAEKLAAAEKILETGHSDSGEIENDQKLESAVVVAHSELEALQATLAAEQAKYTVGAESFEFKALANEASRLQARRDVVLAKHEMLLAGDDEGKQKAAADKLKQAEDRLAKADSGSGDYQPLRVSRKALETPAHNFETYGTSYASSSTGRRLALARWIIDRRNPLTARVAVNHVWMRHFNQPLVESVFDFGLRAPLPEQAELLDFLAWEFMESGWSFRHLHRLIVMSQAYQLSSSTLAAPAENLQIDPTNQFYWRMNARRMESQVVRDSLVYLAGELNQTMLGPSVEPSSTSRRRSLYFKHSRDQQDLMLSIFDDADLLACYRRTESIVPQQALAMANSRLTFDMAVKIAQRITSDIDVSDEELGSWIETAFFQLLGRSPSTEELDECLRFCDDIKQLTDTENEQADAQQRVKLRLIHALLNHNDFVTIR